MTPHMITIAEAVQRTGKSRRTIQRLVEKLVQKQPEQVMKEKTDRGYLWRINEQSVQQAYGSRSPADVVSPISQHQDLAPPVPNSQWEKYLEVASQGYTGMMAMHQEVKQVYEKQLHEKNQQIAELTQKLDQARKGLWQRLFGG